MTPCAAAVSSGTDPWNDAARRIIMVRVPAAEVVTYTKDLYTRGSTYSIELKADRPADVTKSW